MDVVFTDAVLILVAQDRIGDVLTEMGRVARKGLVFNEYHDSSLEKGTYYGGRWVYNYESLLARCFPSASVVIEKSAYRGGGWDEYGFLIKVVF